MEDEIKVRGREKSPLYRHNKLINQSQLVRLCDFFFILPYKTTGLGEQLMKQLSIICSTKQQVTVLSHFRAGAHYVQA